MRHALVAIATLGFALTGYGQPEPVVSAPEISTAESTAVNPADAMGFMRVRAIRGPDWEIEKFKNPEGLWGAELRARGAKVTEFGECGEREDWMRFMLWPVDAAKPDLLLVLRYAGGAHGSDALDVIHLKENFRTLFRSVDEFNFNRVKDLDGDGWPEIVATSRHYAYIFDLPWSVSPFPTVVFSYRPDAKKYLCQNYQFADVLSEKALRYRSDFERSPAAKGNFKYDRWNEENRRAFGSLVAWTLETCYMGNSDAAWAYVREFTEPETMNLLQPAITEKLATEPYFQELERMRIRDAAAAN
jgi:hypothetical protein